MPEELIPLSFVLIFIIVPLILPIILLDRTRKPLLHMVWVGFVIFLATIISGTLSPISDGRVTLFQSTLMDVFGIQLSTARQLDIAGPSIIVTMSIYFIACLLSPLFVIRGKKTSLNRNKDNYPKRKTLIKSVSSSICKKDTSTHKSGLGGIKDEKTKSFDMEFHDCPHCGTKGMILMSDGRCPNCKKGILKQSIDQVKDEQEKQDKKLSNNSPRFTLLDLLLTPENLKKMKRKDAWTLSIKLGENIDKEDISYQLSNMIPIYEGDCLVCIFSFKDMNGDDPNGDSPVGTITIPDKLKTPFLGLDSDNPEAIINELGFILIGRSRLSTWWLKDGCFVNIKRYDNGQHIETRFGIGDKNELAVDYEPVKDNTIINSHSNNAEFLHIGAVNDNGKLSIVLWQSLHPDNTTRQAHVLTLTNIPITWNGVGWLKYVYDPSDNRDRFKQLIPVVSHYFEEALISRIETEVGVRVVLKELENTLFEENKILDKPVSTDLIISEEHGDVTKLMDIYYNAKSVNKPSDKIMPVPRELSELLLSLPATPSVLFCSEELMADIVLPSLNEAELNGPVLFPTRKEPSCLWRFSDDMDKKIFKELQNSVNSKRVKLSVKTHLYPTYPIVQIVVSIDMKTSQEPWWRESMGDICNGDIRSFLVDLMRHKKWMCTVARQDFSESEISTLATSISISSKLVDTIHGELKIAASSLLKIPSNKRNYRDAVNRFLSDDLPIHDML